MLALRSAPPVFAPAEAERAARDLYGLAVSARPLSGERDCNFHVRTAEGSGYVLKILGGGDASAAECQVKVLRHLAEQDPSLPVPRVRATLHGGDLGSVIQDELSFETCLLEYLPGRLLTNLSPQAATLQSVGGLMGRVDRALHGFFHPALARPIAWDVRRLPELVEFTPFIAEPDLRRAVVDIAAAVSQLLPTLRGLRSQAIHGDCHGGNILMDDSHRVSGILDFGDMLHGPVILELAVAMAELQDGVSQPRALSPIVEGYGAVQVLAESDVAALFDLVTGRHATTLLLHAWRRRHDPAGARLLDKGAAVAAASLHLLLQSGREAVTREWQWAAGTSAAVEPEVIDLGRRRRLMGEGAELFYDQPLHLVRGEGVWLFDAQGRPHLDVYNNVAHVGHCHPTVVRAIQRQTAVLVTHTRYLHGRILDYAEALLATCPSHLDACIFVNSGSEANDVAWRMAQFATGHGGGLVLAHAYHGITDAVAALTPGVGQPHDPRVVTLAVPPQGLNVHAELSAEALQATRRDVDAAIATLAGRGLRPAALFLDTAATSSGIFDPPPAWTAALEAQVRAAGGLIVADEVQYGLGRSGSHFWGFQRRGMSPDLVTLGKPVGNGYPMGVVIARRELVEAFQARYGFFSTFGGNAVAASAGLAVLDVIEREGLTANARDTGAHLRTQLEALAAEHECLGAVRGAGLLVGLEILAPDAAQARQRTREVVNALARSRVLIGSEGPLANILKLRPPLVFRREHADRLVDAIQAAAIRLR